MQKGQGKQMATRTDNPVTLTHQELKVVLDALHEAAKTSYQFAANKRNQPATRAYAKQRADEALLMRDAIVRRMYSWS